MWTTDRSRRARITPRPVRIVFLVPDDVSNILLDVLFDESMSRWGGRRTPILKTNGKDLSDTTWNFLNYWDPDIVYSYVPLTDSFRDQIAFRLAPSEIQVHQNDDAGPKYHAYRPEYSGNLEYLKSISLLPIFAKHRNQRGQPLPDVLDRERWSDVPRDLVDSFGFASDFLSCSSLLPFARCFSFNQPHTKNFTPRFRGDDVVRYVEDLPSVKREIADNHGLLTLSQLSDMYCPYLKVLAKHRPEWGDSLTVVIGDGVDDRLLFWNGVHFYSSLSYIGNLQLIRVSPDYIHEGIPDWLMKLCSGQRNHRHYRDNHAAFTTLRTCSLEPEALQPIRDQILEEPGNMVEVKRHNLADLFKVVELNEEQILKSTLPDPLPMWNSPTPQKGMEIRLDRNELDIPQVLPWHLAEAPWTSVTTGSWVIDIKIERREDHSRYSNRIHTWRFPRRLAVHQSLWVDNNGKDMLTFPPVARPTMIGELSLWEGWDWKRPTLSIPNDLAAVINALHYWHPQSSHELRSYKVGAKSCRTPEVEVSDKGRDMLGVLQYFHNLSEAMEFLSHEWVVRLFSKLSPINPVDDPKRANEIGSIIEKTILDSSSTDIDYRRLGERVLTKAGDWADAVARKNSQMSLAKIKQMRPKGLSGNAWDGQLKRCLVHLRDIKVLEQGYGWRCNLCQHRNWVGLEKSQAQYECEVCLTPKNAPIGGDENIHFRLNAFVAAAFSPSSAQGSVFWCISKLYARAQWSFMIVPTLEIAFENSDTKTDIDVLSIVDGKVHMFEVKSSFSAINEKEIEMLIKVAETYRPDVIGFAIPKPRVESRIKPEQQLMITRALEPISVEFEVLTLDSEPRCYGAQSLPEGIIPKMKWSIGRHSE